MKRILIFIILIILVISLGAERSKEGSQDEDKSDTPTSAAPIDIETIRTEIENINDVEGWDNLIKKLNEGADTKVEFIKVDGVSSEKVKSILEEINESSENVDLDKIMESIHGIEESFESKPMTKERKKILESLLADWIETSHQDKQNSIEKLTKYFKSSPKGVSSSPLTQLEIKRFTETSIYKEIKKQKQMRKEADQKASSQQKKDESKLLEVDDNGNIVKTHEIKQEDIQTYDQSKEKLSDTDTNDGENKEEIKKEEKEETVLDRIILTGQQEELMKIKREYFKNNTLKEPTNINGLIEAYEKHAQHYENDSGIAWYNIGILYRSNQYGIKNLTTYKHYMMQSSSRGNVRAQYELAHLYQNEWVSLEDYHIVNERLKKKFYDDSSPISYGAEAFIHYYFAALGGHTKSQMVLGHRHYHGISVTKSCRAAEIWYNLAATTVFNHMMRNFLYQLKEEKKYVWDTSDPEEDLSSVMELYKYQAQKGDAKSQVVYGYAKMLGLHGVEQDTTGAAELFRQALANGAVEANGPLGQLYLSGIGGFPKDNATALSYFEKGSALSDPVSMAGLGLIYLRGYGVAKDPVRAFYYFNESAYLGNPQAQYNLGLLYLRGDGVAQSYSDAHHYLKLSAIQGALPAQYQLGLLYMNGLGVPSNCEVAVKYLKHVSERGRELVANSVAYSLYESGEKEDSLFLYSQLAETGDSHSLSNLAYMYDRHLGVSPLLSLSQDNRSLSFFSESMALRWRLLSASHLNDHEAHIRVGDYYFYGKGTPRDYAQALRHYRRASRFHLARASYNLGFMHEYGLGLSQDFHLAKRFYDQAASEHPLARIPVTITLIRLYARWYYSSICSYFNSSWNSAVNDALSSIENIEESVSEDDGDDIVLPFFWFISDVGLLCVCVTLLISLLWIRPYIVYQPPRQSSFILLENDLYVQHIKIFICFY